MADTGWHWHVCPILANSTWFLQAKMPSVGISQSCPKIQRTKRLPAKACSRSKGNSVKPVKKWSYIQQSEKALGVSVGALRSCFPLWFVTKPYYPYCTIKKPVKLQESKGCSRSCASRGHTKVATGLMDRPAASIWCVAVGCLAANMVWDVTENVEGPTGWQSFDKEDFIISPPDVNLTKLYFQRSDRWQRVSR